MRVISCRNFRKTTLQKKSLTSIATGLVILLFLLLMIHSNDVDDGEEEDNFTICDGFDDKTLASFLKPDRDTAIIVPKFISNNNAINERKFLASFVISSPENIEARQIIRKTWGSIIKPVFMIGKSDERNLIEITKEADEYDDIILEDFIDTYENLTIKTGFTMKNFIRYFNDSTYFMKIDEDVILNIDKFYKMLKHVPKATLVGALTDVTRPIRDINDKWFIPKCQYQKEFYPKYLQGAMYLIPGWDTKTHTKI